MTEKKILDRIKTEYGRILGDNLVGIYVHGSIAFGCFNWKKSDIDFIAVVRKPLTLSVKAALIRSLLELDPECPQKGLEMSVVLAQVCNPFVYPTPYELHFSNSHKQAYLEDLCGYCEKLQGVDVDLAAHFTVIRECGIVLTGAPIEQVFWEVPTAAYLDSIRNDISGAKEEITENPVYIILNLCRVLAFLREGSVLSKAQGGEWGCRKLPGKYVPVVMAAKESYSGEGTVRYRMMEGHGVYSEKNLESLEPELLQEFAGYMLQEMQE